MRRRAELDGSLIHLLGLRLPTKGANPQDPPSLGVCGIYYEIQARYPFGT